MTVAKDITVLITVGPFPHNVMHLQEAVDSVLSQTMAPKEVLFIDDMSTRTPVDLGGRGLESQWRAWQTPWRLGIAGAGNCGVGLADTECIIPLASDDQLHPMAVERCQTVWDARPVPLAYYWFDIQLTGLEEKVMSMPSGAAMVTKTLWRETGGYPIEGSVGHSDSMLVGIMEQLGYIDFVHVVGPDMEPLYIARQQAASDSILRSTLCWDETIGAVREQVIKTWERPMWGRYIMDGQRYEGVGLNS